VHVGALRPTEGREKIRSRGGTTGERGERQRGSGRPTLGSGEAGGVEVGSAAKSSPSPAKKNRKLCQQVGPIVEDRTGSQTPQFEFGVSLEWSQLHLEFGSGASPPEVGAIPHWSSIKKKAKGRTGIQVTNSFSAPI
jgi:hypothetical protein